NSDGTASPNPVVFYYNAIPKEPARVDVQVIYQAVDGTVLGNATQTCVENQANEVYAIEIDGYTLATDMSAAVQTVTVNSDGTASPNPVIFYYNAVQQEPDPVPATVTISYVGEDGREVAPSDTVTYTVDGTYTVSAAQAGVDGNLLELISAYEVTVNVTGGVADPAQVSFVYREKQQQPDQPAEPVSATISVYYRNQDNQNIADAQSVTLPGGQITAVAPDANLVPEDYDASSAQAVNVEVTAEGVATPAEVVFTFAKAVVEEPDVPVPQGEMINRFGTVTDAQVGLRTSMDDSSKANLVTRLTKGTVVYLLREEINDKGESWTRVLVDGEQYFIKTQFLQMMTKADSDAYMAANYPEPIPPLTEEDLTGGAEPEPEPEPEPVTVDVPVIYVTEAGAELDRQTTPASSAQPVIITPTSGKVEGYILVSASSVQVTVDAATGAATPAEVVFTYREPEPEVKTAPVTVLYITEDGQELDRQTITCASDKTTTITPTSGKTEGYALVSAGSVEVTVDQQTGAASQSEVRFTYRVLPPATVTVDVPVIYVTEDGVELDRQTITCTSAVATNVMPTSSKVSGYTLTSAASVQVTVDASTGAAAPAEVRFTYARPAQYEGYALTTQAVALRTEISTSDSSIITALGKDTLVYVYGQQYDAGNQAWSSVSTLDEQPGMVVDSALRRITNEEAQYYINLWEEQHKPEDPPTPTATPPQVAGTAVTIGDGVPFRQTYDATGAIIAVLPKDTEVEVLGQAYTMNGEAWHSVRYSGNLGYIRADMLRFVTNTDAPATTQPTVNPDGLSAYGYVSSSTVNFRQAASTSSTRLRVLKQYAMCLVLGTEQVGDTTWYHVKYDGQEGYIAGSYFKHMTISEVNSFLSSDQYRQGVLNNSTANNNQDNTGSYVGGGVVSEEDKKVDEWTNPNSGLNVSYEPFDPFATVEPIATETPDPFATEEPSASPEATATLELLPTLDINDPGENQGGGSAVGWIIAIVILALGGGGVYAYVLYTQNKRKAAQRAAQRRAQAAQQQRANTQQRPGQPNQPRTGTYTNQAGAARPTGYQQPQARKPYAPGQSAYQRPAGQQPQQGASAYQRPAGQTSVNTMGGDETIRPTQSVSGSQPNPYSRPTGGYTGASPSFTDSDETIRPTQSSPYSRPAGQTDSSFTASFRDPQAPSTTQRMGRRQYRSQQNSSAFSDSWASDATNADKPSIPSADSDDFKSDPNADDFS
ncbi:MAG: SH3 domain-containing protein, partial [Eubacteriales bacterium]|nr:SH3 domain-containing protein [Eubacteriales bacterium]